MSDMPLVTVIMPVRNEEAFIEQSLGAVLSQDYPADRLEVIVADGMSEDATVEIIHRIANSQRVRVIENPRRIQAAGMNAAIAQARGEIIIRVDGHTIIAPDYISRCVETLRKTGAHNVGGAMDPVGITWIGRAIAAAGKSPFAVPTAFHISQQPQVTDTVYLGAWPRAVLEQIGPFNERVNINEDYELNFRIRQNGGQVYFSPAIQSTYYGRQTFGALGRQYFRYGRAKVRTLIEHPKSAKLRHLVAPAFVAALILGGGAALLNVSARALWLLMIGAYLAGDTLFSIRATAERGWRQLPALLLVFPIIHISWGAGFWFEVFRVDRRGKQ